MDIRMLNTKKKKIQSAIAQKLKNTFWIFRKTKWEKQ